jgi:hypothetical protein
MNRTQKYKLKTANCKLQIGSQDLALWSGNRLQATLPAFARGSSK